MAFIRKRKRNGRVYYSAVTSYREKGKVKKIEKYIGKHKPTKEQLKKLNPFIISYLNKEEIENINVIRDKFEKEKYKMPKSAREKELKDFLIRFTYNTNRIEGSTLTLMETKLIIDDKITPKGKPLEDIKEVENHVKAFNFILKWKKDINLEFIKKINKIILTGIKDDIAGKVRDFNVRISGSEFKPCNFEDLNFELKAFLEWYNQSKKLHPFERAMLSHLKFVTIHPFGDGNGRTARLLMNFILKQYGYPMLDIPYKDRAGYYNSLENCQLKKKRKPFVDYCYKEYLKQNKE